MERNLYLDPNTNDLVLNGSKNLAMTANAVELLAQRITNRLRFFKAEWYLDRSLGVPYFEEVLKKNPNIAKVRALLLSVVAKTNGVAKVLAFDTIFDAQTRIFSVNFKVQSSDGSVVQGVV